MSQNSKHTLLAARGSNEGPVSKEGIHRERKEKKCALLKKPHGKIFDFLEVSDFISNEIEDVEERKCVLTFIILNRLP